MTKQNKTSRLFSEIHKSGPHAGRRVWVREYLDADGRVSGFDVVMPKTKTQRRQVSISVVHPVWATVYVERASDEDQWGIVGVHAVACDASARSLTENMQDEDWTELDEAANAAKDEG